MVLNDKPYGVLTTVNGWVFLKRENNRTLHMTSMVDCRENRGQFTILKALYYISHIALRDQDLMETDRRGEAVVFEPENVQKAVLRRRENAATSSAAAPAGRYPSGRSAPRHSAAVPSTSAPSADVEESFTAQLDYELVPVNRVELFFEPWKKENHWGGKAFRGTLVMEDERLLVIVKLWDGYKISVKKRDNEAKVYMALQSLWGKHIPKLIGTAEIEICWGIFTEEIKVIRVCERSKT
jgi:hypothetical protein